MSVTSASGFLAAGVASGIKANGALDLALVAAAAPAVAAGVFTRSLTAAPPVHLSRERAATGRARAIVINSGCANSGTGAAGLQAAMAMADAVAAALGCPTGEVLVCSTGPIGENLPIPKISAAAPALVAALSGSDAGGESAARAIMTTDSRPKQASLAVGGAVIGGMAKGAGMIRPDMATMLAVITTDAVVDAGELASALSEAVDVTFNCLNVDGCQSTNDSVIALASGSSGVVLAAETLRRAMTDVCRSLARQMAEDAEGATKVVTLKVSGAASDADARKLGMVVADSALVRSSFFGADPNWGRILSALGVAGVQFDPNAVVIRYEEDLVCSGGVGVDFDDDALALRLKGDFNVEISVGDGAGRAEVVTTDLTPEYVRYNGARS